MNQLTQQGLFIIEGRATYERIVNYIREVEAGEAIRQVQNFLKIYPEFAQAHNDLAVLYYQNGNGMKALAHYEKAHKLEPSNITYRKNLADFYFVELDWSDDAIQTYLDILKDNPFDIDTLNALGTISTRIGRREQARQYFARTLQLDSVNSYARQSMQQLGGQLPQPLQQNLQIENTTHETANTAPHMPFSDHRNLDEMHTEALRLVQEDRLEEAHALLEELAHVEGSNAVYHNDLGFLRHRLGNVDGARQSYELAVELQPDNANFQKNLADLYAAELNRIEDAIFIYLNLLEQSPRDVEVLVGLGIISLAVGQREEAKSFYRRALEIDPWNMDIRSALQDLFE